MRSLTLAVVLLTLCVGRGMEAPARADGHDVPIQEMAILKAPARQVDPAEARARAQAKAPAAAKNAARDAQRADAQGLQRQPNRVVAEPQEEPLPACWVEVWGKPVSTKGLGKNMHHSGVAYMRSRHGLINVQFYCNHGTCPGYMPRNEAEGGTRKSMDLVFAKSWNAEADCPRYLLSCDMLRLKSSSDDNPQYFTYMNEGHVCNTDTELELFAFNNKIKDVEALNRNPALLKEAYKICSETICRLSPDLRGGGKATVPEVYNVWKNPNYRDGLYFVENEDPAEFKSYLWWRPENADENGIYYPSLTPMDENDTDAALRDVVLKKKSVWKAFASVLFAPTSPRTMDVIVNQKVDRSSQHKAGTSRADFVIASGDIHQQPLKSRPDWLDKPDMWYSRAALRVRG